MRVQLNDAKGFLSLAPDSAVNTPQILTANFIGTLFNAFLPPIPVPVTVANAMVGDGSERAQRLRRGWIPPIAIPIAGDLNTETAARIGGRGLGGTRTVGSELTPSGSGAFDVTWLTQTKAQGRGPILSSFGFDLSDFDFVFASMAVRNFDIAFAGEGAVTFTSELVNTGQHLKNKTAAALQALGFTAAQATALAIGSVVIVPPAAPTHHLMHPAATKLTFSDGSTRDPAADGALISGSCGLNNNIVVKQLPGDPFIVPTIRKSGAYAREIHRGTREPMARMKVDATYLNRAYLNSMNGSDITSLTFLFRSEDPIGTSPYFYEFEWVCPLSELESPVADPDGDDAAVTLNFYPKTDPTTGGYWIQRVRTGDNTLA